MQNEVLELFDSVDQYDSSLGINEEEEEARYKAQLKAEKEELSKVDEIFIEGNPGEVLPTGHKPYVEPKKLKIQPKPEIKVEPKIEKKVENKSEMNYTLIKTIKVFKVSFLCVFCRRDFEDKHKIETEDDEKVFKDKKNWSNGRLHGVCHYCKLKPFGP